MLYACVAGYLAQLATPAVTERFALFGPAVQAGEWWRLVSVGFLHLNFIHLLMNCVSIALLGSLLEPLFAVAGRWRFATLYALALIGGSIGALMTGFDALTVGASGAVFGLLAAAIAVPMRCGFGANRFNALPWLIGNLALTFALPNISAGGHLGGMVAGFITAWFLAPVGVLKDTRASS
jgi:membrane associated rhomboid family serine protease